MSTNTLTAEHDLKVHDTQVHPAPAPGISVGSIAVILATLVGLAAAATGILWLARQVLIFLAFD